MNSDWDEDGFQPDPPETDLNPDQPEVETTDEYGPVDTHTQQVEAPDDIPNGDDA